LLIVAAIVYLILHCTVLFLLTVAMLSDMFEFVYPECLAYGIMDLLIAISLHLGLGDLKLYYISVLFSFCRKLVLQLEIQEVNELDGFIFLVNDFHLNA
jgi:uncharacterized membrane protein (DUF441 family)